MLRRSFLALPAAAFAIGEYDAGNVKLAHRTPWNASDDELLFLKQIGLRWVRLEYGGEDPGVDALSRVQKRFARFGLGIYGAVHNAYRSLKIQLGQAGRDADIETYRTFLRSLGALGIPVAPYDFHPGNTYTTADRRAARLPRARVQPGRFSRQGRKAPLRARILRRRDLGPLHLLHARRPAGGRKGRREARAAPGRPAAGDDERRGQGVHRLRGVPARGRDCRREPRMGHPPVRGHLGRRRRQDGQGRLRR